MKTTKDNTRGVVHVWPDGSTVLDIGGGWTVEIHYYADEPIPSYLIGGPAGQSLHLYEPSNDAGEPMATAEMIQIARTLRDHYRAPAEDECEHALLREVAQEVSQ